MVWTPYETPQGHMSKSTEQSLVEANNAEGVPFREDPTRQTRVALERHRHNVAFPAEERRDHDHTQRSTRARYQAEARRAVEAGRKRRGQK